MTKRWKLYARVSNTEARNPGAITRQTENLKQAIRLFAELKNDDCIDEFIEGNKSAGRKSTSAFRELLKLLLYVNRFKEINSNNLTQAHRDALAKLEEHRSTLAPNSTFPAADDEILSAIVVDNLQRFGRVLSGDVDGVELKNLQWVSNDLVLRLFESRGCEIYTVDYESQKPELTLTLRTINWEFMTVQSYEIIQHGAKSNHNKKQKRENNEEEEETKKKEKKF